MKTHYHKILKLESWLATFAWHDFSLCPQLSRVEGDNATYQHLLPDSPGPSVSHGLSDYDLSEKSSSSRDQKPDSETEKTSVGANTLSQGELWGMESL